jgi:hypothetical protein
VDLGHGCAANGMLAFEHAVHRVYPEGLIFSGKEELQWHGAPKPAMHSRRLKKTFSEKPT